MVFLSDEFFFARHGETDYNSKGVVTGAFDAPLNDTGRLQASLAADKVKELQIRSCIISPLVRVLETATLMLAHTNIIPQKVANLYERDWGELTGTEKCELDRYDFAEKKVETWQSFSARSIEAIKSVKAKSPVLIVAHSGTFRVLCEYLDIHIRKKPVKNAWPYRFYKAGGKWCVKPL